MNTEAFCLPERMTTLQQQVGGLMVEVSDVKEGVGHIKTNMVTTAAMNHIFF